jgi:carbonic anhydrase/acetyltransferase-like protein (isoleucine patch superfamily)
LLNKEVEMIITYKDKTPKIAKSAFVAETAVIIGDVTIEEDANIWYGAVLRGDIAPIIIKKGANIQDNTVIHVDTDIPCIVGEYVTVGHAAILHSTTIDAESLIGMGATLLTGSHIGSHSVIGANALVAENKTVPEGVIAVGLPAKVVRTLTEKEKAFVKENALHYIQLAEEYKK